MRQGFNNTRYFNVWISELLSRKSTRKVGTTIYVAKEDIQAKTEVNESMFTPVHIAKGGLLKGYVTDISQIKGAQLKGGLLKGEPIATQRLESKKKTRMKS